MSRKGDKGKRLALTPNLLVVGPSNEAAARALLLAQKDAAGADNINYGTAELLVTPYLD
jgi:phage major head subunit gpT-like protein